LVGDVADRLKELVYERAEMMGCKVITLEVMPDHVHLFIQGDPELTPNKIIGKIKGYTSHELRREFKELTTRLPTLWTWILKNRRECDIFEAVYQVSNISNTQTRNNTM